MPTLPTAVFDGSFFEVENTSNRDNSLAFSSSSVTMETLGNHIRIHEPRDLASDKNATIAMMAHQRYVIQVVASTMSTISLLSALMAVYWFCMMRRNFRRDLVLLLILAGSWRSLWFLIQSGSTFMHGGMISTESPFCQASGYLLLVGFQGCGKQTLSSRDAEWCRDSADLCRSGDSLHEHAHVPADFSTYTWTIRA